MSWFPAVMIPLLAAVHPASADARGCSRRGGKKGVSVILPAPVYNSRTGNVYELPADTIKAFDSYCLFFAVPILEQWLG